VSDTGVAKGTLVHQEVALDVGNKVCILAGDFLLSKAAVELSLLDNDDVTELIAAGLEAICEGGMLSSDLYAAMAEGAGLESYLAASEQNTGELVAKCCHSSALLSGHDLDSIEAQACLVFGKGIAMAQQLVTEAEQTETLIKACKRNHKWPESVAPNAPLLYAADRNDELRPIIERGYARPADVSKTVQLLERSKAVAHTLRMAAEHAQDAADALDALPSSTARDSLRVLCHKVITSSPIK